jgi:hypothetical protein
MALYTLLLRDPAVEPPGRGEADWAALFDRFVAWAADLDRRDKLRGAARLVGPGARVVRAADGRVIVDGPFAETKETVLGFFVVEARDEEEALALAAEAPSVPLGGTVEVRLVGDFPKPR